MISFNNNIYYNTKLVWGYGALIDRKSLTSFAPLDLTAGVYIRFGERSDPKRYKDL